MPDKKQFVKNFSGERIGELRTDWKGNINAYDRYGGLLGTYNPKLNITTEFPSGRILATGDITNALIWNKENERKQKMNANK